MSIPNILNQDQTHNRKEHLLQQPGTRKKLQHFSYDLTQIIGKGYSSQVFKGKNDNTNQPVAIKVIDMKMLKCEVNRILLHNQIQNLKALSKTNNILQLIEVYNTKNNTYIITELCDSDLSKKIKKKMEESEALNHFQQLIQGYICLHKKEIIHRDLKPANVLIKNGILKIADLGFSIKAADALKPSKYNVGSPLYMAPQSLKKNQYSYKSDIWALGVICYQMIFNHPPWRAKNQKQLIQKIQGENIQTLMSSNNNNINLQLKEFLIKSLTYDQNQRLSPEELQKFNFDGSLITKQSIYTSLNKANLINKPFKEKMLNEQRTGLTKNQSLNPSSMNFDQSINNPENVTFKPKRIIYSPQKTTNDQRKQSSNRQNRKKIFDNLTTTITTTTTATTLATTSNTDDMMRRQDKKQITKILISQVHFCRFLFKLNDRIKKQTKLTNFSSSQELIQNYTKVIIDKILKVKDFQKINFINTKFYQEYKTTADFLKVRKISRQYYIRYSQQTGLDAKDAKYDVSTIIKLTEKAIGEIANQLNREVQVDNIVDYSPSIIILDYLITTYQLFGLILDTEDYLKFSKKSKIQEIVEGTPTTLTINHFYKIIQKLKQLKLA